MILADEPQSERHTAVLLPKSQRVVRVFEPRSAPKSCTNHIPAIRMRFAQIIIGKISQPVILVGAIIREREIMVPMTKIKDEVKMEALSPTVYYLIPSIISETLEDVVRST